jgi:exonuclease SbcC
MEITNLKSNLKSSVKKIYHMADIHIRIYDRHDEYRGVFKKLYELIKNDSNDSIIVICGDILHSKNELSPECIQLVIEFLKNLANITDVILIMGNHDGNLSNKKKLDSLSPLVNEIKANNNIHYLLQSGIYSYQNILFGVSSLMDDIFISAKDIPGANKIKIALCHQTLANSVTDVGHRLNGEQTIDDFIGYDYVLLGDIHRFQYMDENERICYPSSLIQQNYGETLNNHGIVLWNLEQKTSKFIEILNEYGYCCLTVKNGKLEKSNSKIPNKPRIKLIVENTDGVTVKELTQKLKKQYNVQEITYSIINNNFKTNKQDGIHKDTDLYQNLQDVKYQNTLIKDYIMKNMKLTKEDTDAIIEINNKLNKEIVNNINVTNKWKLLSMDFSNMFCYGLNNEIQFSKLNGIVGLFAPNHSGKSSIVDIILFTLFDRCSRGLRTDIMNQRKKQFHCRITLEIDGCEYVIMRIGKFPKQNAKNIKIDVHLWKLNPNAENEDDQYLLLNGVDRNDTNRIITNLIGTYDDYIMTSFCLQKEISFLDYPQSKKKEFLMKMLKLNIYEQLLDYAKTENKVKSLQLKDLITKTKNVDIYELRNNLSELQKTKNENELTIEKITSLIEKYHIKNDFCNKKLVAVKKPLSNKTSNAINNEIELNNKKIINIQNKIKNFDNSEYEKHLNKFKEDFNILDPTSITEKYNNFNDTKTQKIDKLNKELKKLYESKKSVRKFDKSLEDYNNEKEELDEKLVSFDEILNKYNNEITTLTKKLIDESTTETITNIYNEYLKYSNENKDLTTKCNMIDNEINQMESKLDKLSQHKYNPDCEYCMNNIFVQDAIKTKTLLKEKMIEKNNINIKINEFNKKLTLKKYTNIENKYNELSDITNKNNKVNNMIKDLTHKKELLNKDILLFRKEQNNLIKVIYEFKAEIENIKFNQEVDKKISKLGIELKETQISKFELYDKFMELKNNILQTENQINNNNQEISKLMDTIQELEKINKSLNEQLSEIKMYETAIKNNVDIESEITKIKENILKNTNEIKKIQKNKDELIEKICYIKKEIEIYDKHKEEIKLLEVETNAYNNYIKIVNKDGLPYILLNNLIPLLQEGTNNILLPLTNFSINIEQENDNITVYKVDKNSKLNIELCSGFEKFIVALAIRISLINLSKLSSCNFMLIDEGFSCMDSNNINNLTSLFNTLKDMFDFVIIISHLDSVKSQCDNNMSISINNSGFSQISLL